MQIEYHKWYSPNLGQDMELKVYGYFGKPVLVFPAQGSRFFGAVSGGDVGERVVAGAHFGDNIRCPAHFEGLGE